MGTIPTELCLLGDNLEKLNLSNNQLGGTIPDCIVNFVNLKSLALNNNLLEGPLPPLAISRLTTADLSNNELTGTLDRMFAAAVRFNQALMTLRLDHNQFSGAMPALQGANALSTLSLTDNDLTGEVTFCLFNESQFDEFEVDCLEVNCTCCTNC